MEGIDAKGRSRFCLLLLLLVFSSFYLTIQYSNASSRTDLSSKVDHKIDFSPEIAVPSSSLKLDALVSHQPISIIDDADFHTQAASEGWDLGGTRDGSQALPYVISNYSIVNDTPQYLVNIGSTSLWFIIRNVLVDALNSSTTTAGIRIVNNQHATITNCTVKNLNENIGVNYGILVDSSPTTIVTNNTVISAGWRGILASTSDNSIIANNTIKHIPYFGISNSGSNDVTITNNYLENCSSGIIGNQISQNNISQNYLINIRDSGISTSQSSDNIISTNEIYDSYSGIHINNPVSDNNTLIDNHIENIEQSAIYLYYASNGTYSRNTLINASKGFDATQAKNNTFSDNQVLNSRSDGMYLAGSSDNYFVGNTVFNSTLYGIRIWTGSVSNMFQYNAITNSTYGIQDVTGSTNHTYRNNVIANVSYGIYFQSSTFPTVSNNYVNAFSFGVYLYTTLNSTIIGNTYTDSINDGVYLFASPNSTIVANNFACPNNNAGIFLLDTSPDSSYTTIRWNNFYGCTKPMDDEDGNHTLIEYNYDNLYSDTDNNNDLYFDNPVAIPGAGGTQGTSFLVQPNTLDSPSIVTPLLGQSFTNQIDLTWTNVTNSYNHSVTFSVYYTFNGSKNWQPIVTDLTSLGYSWDTSSVVQGVYRLMVVSESLGFANSTISDPFTILNLVPDAVQFLSGSVENEVFILTWQAPAYSGSSAIIEYQVLRGTSSGSYDTIFTTLNTAYNDTPADIKVTYYYAVVAVNNWGVGDFPTEVVLQVNVPSEVTGFSGTVTNGVNFLTWSIPISDGGSPIQEYRIQRGTTSGVYDTGFTIYNTGEFIGVTQFNDTYITLTNTYYYVIAAVNRRGESVKSPEIMVHDSKDPVFSVEGLNVTGANHVSTNMTVTVTPTDENGISSVLFEITGDNLQNPILDNQTTSPYAYSLIVNNFEYGNYSMKITVTDNAKNAVFSQYSIIIEEPQDTGDTGTTGGNGGPDPLFIGIAGGSVVIVTGVLLSIRIRKNKKK